MEMPFKEGTIVKRGDLLAVIDEQPFMVDLDSKLADQQRAESTLAIARITFQRNVLLKSRHAVADQEYDNAKAACDQAAAALAAANAAVASSRLNLEWCRVRSPIDGRVSNKLVTVGNLVTGGAGQAPPTLLTTVTSVSPMYLYVDVDEHSILKYQKLAEERKLLSARDGKLPCFFELENETDFPHQGSIDFMDNHVDSTTGTIKVRAVLRNDSGKFIPGCFARMRVPGSGRYRTLLVPDDAVGSDQNEHNVLVVDKDNKVQVRPVQLGALFGDLRSILSGISADDRVVVNGQMHARPGFPVTPTEVTIKAEAGAFSDPGTRVAERDASLDAKALQSSVNSVAMPSVSHARAAGRGNEVCRLLHRAAGICRRHLDRHGSRRRDRRFAAAERAVSRNCPADRHRDRGLSRRERQNGCRIDRHAN